MVYKIKTETKLQRKTITPRTNNNCNYNDFHN